jgi:Tfp pilus assembly protein PilV
MKGKLAGNDRNILTSGFSTLELMIAFVLISIVLVGAVGANFTAQYWGINSQTSNEALYKAKTKLEDLRSLVKQDFYQATSMSLVASTDPTDPADAACLAGGLCYFVETTITDLSSCSKYVEAKVERQVENYPKIVTRLFTYLTNSPEVIARGGDCILNEPEGDWQNVSPQNVGSLSFAPGKQFTGIDVLHKKIYTTTNTNPGFIIYNVPTTLGQNPTPVGTLNITVNAVVKTLNDLDVEEDFSTGRTYAFVTVNATSSQLAVIDVTDWSNPALVTQRSLQNVDPYASFPQGWLVFIYGSRLYMTVRETTGNEFHIFDISTPTIPTEIGNGFELNRTVNAMVVRDQKIEGVIHRLVFLAADSNLKELGVLDVTGDVITELNSVDLTGIQDGYSLSLLGRRLYFGRASNAGGGELYVFDISDPVTSLPILGQGEVGANVIDLDVSGRYVYCLLYTSPSPRD